MIQRLQAKRNEEGFTLIELLIVIIVLGILAAIVVFAIGSTRKDSVASSCKTNEKAVELSVESHNTKMGVYPTGVISNTAANPAANAYGAGSPAAVVATTSNILGGAGNTTGDLLKSWPTSSDYALVYVEVPAVGGGSPTPQSFHVDVYHANSSTNAPTALVGSGSSFCDSL